MQLFLKDQAEFFIAGNISFLFFYAEMKMNRWERRGREGRKGRRRYRQQLEQQAAGLSQQTQQLTTDISLEDGENDSICQWVKE